MKSKTQYLCQECGYSSPRWMGRCPDCGKWNTLQEEVLDESADAPVSFSKFSKVASTVEVLSEVKEEELRRQQTGIKELDRLLGGGIVPGAFTLIGGEPGIGKSTLLLQMSRSLAGLGRRVLYVSGEESVAQTKIRAQRLKVSEKALLILSETNVELICQHIQKEKPDCVVIDSIQALYHPGLSSAPGSVSQVRESAFLFLSLCKGMQVPVFLVGHVTKDGSLAGPRVLEHLVDTVLYFEGDRFLNFRILRAVKNRFGSTNEVGLFEMGEDGLQEVSDPSSYLLSQRLKGASGSVVVPAMEGSRPFLLEFQALVCAANFPVAQRVTTGVDYNRFCLLLAVLEKKVGLNVLSQDVFVNVAGGFKVSEPAADLGIALCIVSSFRDLALPEDTVVFGEIGLAGEVRAVQQPEKRIVEAEKQGFKKCVIPAHHIKSLKKREGIQIIGAASLEEAIETLLKR